jgi:hypothetical protein
MDTGSSHSFIIVGNGHELSPKVLHAVGCDHLAEG